MRLTYFIIVSQGFVPVNTFIPIFCLVLQQNTVLPGPVSAARTKVRQDHLWSGIFCRFLSFHRRWKGSPPPVLDCRWRHTSVRCGRKACHKLLYPCLWLFPTAKRDPKESPLLSDYPEQYEKPLFSEADGRNSVSPSIIRVASANSLKHSAASLWRPLSASSLPVRSNLR